VVFFVFLVIQLAYLKIIYVYTLV